MKFVVLFFCITFISLSLCAQDDIEVTVNAKNDSVTTTRDHYIQRYKDHFFLWPVLKQRTLSFDIQNTSGSRDKLTFKPNNSYSFGLGIYLFELGLEFTFAIPVNGRSKEQYGTTYAKDIQINALSTKFGFDLYNQKYTGFYQTDSKGVITGGIFPQRSDIVTKNFGLSGFYILYNKKFSIRSAYNFAERQLRSHGSPLIVGSLNAFKLSADSSVLSYEYRKSFGEEASFKNLKYTTLSFAPGYTYSVIYKQFFLNATLVFGPAHNWIYYKQNNGKEKNDISINTYTSVRVAIGYNSDHFFAGINFVSQSRNVKIEGIQFTNTNSTFKLMIGYRFREFGFLKKSVWDIPRELLK